MRNNMKSCSATIQLDQLSIGRIAAKGVGHEKVSYGPVIMSLTEQLRRWRCCEERVSYAPILSF